MCGRFTRKYSWRELHDLYRLTAPKPIPNFQPDYNVCPTDPADVVVAKDGAHELVRMRWGLVPFWWSKPLKELRLATFNARVETVTTKSFFREPFKTRRCLMPLSGYYEWQDKSDGKQPHYFTARDGSPLVTAAGLWDEWKNRETGERIKSCTMIITQPNAFVAEVHDRMPVLLQPDQFDHWLSGDMSVDELKPAPDNYLQRWAVSKRVNSSKADKDDATLIEPVEEAA
jgi:putative SOS response-associated peptidase YedK